MLLTSGCAVGPNYKRPSVNVPGIYRGAKQQEAEQPAAESLGDQKWWELFQDQQLQDLIHTALQQNYDVRIAATRILEARAQVGITRADQLPTISAGAQSVDQRSARQKFFPAFETSAHQVDLSLAWDLDFWGKYRRANESARANLLATEWAREAVISTLVSDVASAYFQLPATRDLSSHAGFAPGLVETHASVSKRRGYIHARRPAGGAVGVHRGRNHSRSGAPH
jgi:multidrug efflux system outer membrane protein